MTWEEERELLRLTRENNQMLKVLLSIVREHTSPEAIEKENTEDMIRNIIANLISTELGKQLKL